MGRCLWENPKIPLLIVIHPSPLFRLPSPQPKPLSFPISKAAAAAVTAAKTQVSRDKERSKQVSRNREMGGRGRSRTQRKHFRQSRENVWKRPKPDDSANATPADANSNIHRGWEPFATQNPAFDEYYKVSKSMTAKEIYCLRIVETGFVLSCVFLWWGINVTSLYIIAWICIWERIGARNCVAWRMG